MEISGRYHVAAPPLQVWQALNDPVTLKACIPGCNYFERVGMQKFQVSTILKNGFMKAKFHGRLEQVKHDPPHHCALRGQAEGGAAGSATGEADIVLAPDTGGTMVSYTVRASLRGKLAQMGQRPLDRIAKQMADDFFVRLQNPSGEPAQPSGLAEAIHQGRDTLAPEIWVVGLIGVVVILLGLFGLTL